jgi:LysR family transcriptional regulator, glycine cleavage system transcriptional activator
LRRAADLRHHALLHLEGPGMAQTWFDWDTWLTAFGIADMRPAGALHFTEYDQIIQATLAGQGVALGRLPLLDDLIRTGRLVAPFAKTVAGTRGYVVLRSPASAANPDVTAFCNWLFTQAQRP